MLKRVAFGAFLPDLPPGEQVTVAQNVYPVSGGYGPVGSFQSFTPALPGFSGGAAFVGSDGTAAFLAGNSTDLFRFSGAAWASVLAGQSAKRWRFGQFGDNVIAVNGSTPVTFDLIGGTASALSGSPPVADMVAIVRDFVVMAGDPAAILSVTWSGNNDSTQWTPGTGESDTQQMLDGGEVMGLAGGEYGIILQKNAIKRMSYEGPPIGFRFDEISSNVGCMAKGSVAQAGRLVFFLSERGFMLCDGNEARPIGAEKVDRTFFAAYARSEIESGLYAAVDPRRHQVIWSMPGRPGTAWVYNWVLDRWTTIATSLSAVFSGFTANISLDALDALYPGGIDTIPVSLDDPIFAGGSPLLLVVDADRAVGTLSSGPMEALVTTADLEIEAGRARVRRVRPITDSSAASVIIDGRPRPGALSHERTGGSMRSNGDIPIRFNARHFEASTTIPAGAIWSYLQGLDFEYERAGRR